MIFKNVQNGTHIFGIFWNQEPVRLDEPSQSFAIPDDVPEVSEYTIDPENAKASGQTMIAADDLLHSFLKIIFLHARNIVFGRVNLPAKWLTLLCE